MPDPAPVFQTTWNWLVVIYLFLAGVGAGSYLTAWWAERRGLSPHIAKVGRLLAPPLVAIGTAMLIFDLGAGLREPWRLIRLYIHPTSMMSLGTWVLSIFLILAVIDGYGPFVKLPRFKALGVVTAAFAVFLGIYTGFLLGIIAAVPFWHNPVMPLLFLVSAASTGMAATLGTTALIYRKGEEVTPFGMLHLGLVSAEAVLAVVFLFFAATSTAKASTYAFTSLISGRFAAGFWIGFVLIGLAAPFVYNVLAHRPQRGPKHGPEAPVSLLHAPVAVMLESLCVLAGGFVLRFLVVYAGSIAHYWVSAQGMG